MMLDVNLQERQTTGCFAILLFVQRGFFNYFCWFLTLQLFLARVSQLGGLEHRAVGMSKNLVGTSFCGLVCMICSSPSLINTQNMTNPTPIKMEYG